MPSSDGSGGGPPSEANCAREPYGGLLRGAEDCPDPLVRAARAVAADAVPEGGAPSSGSFCQDTTRPGADDGLGSPQHWRVFCEEKSQPAGALGVHW